MLDFPSCLVPHPQEKLVVPRLVYAGVQNHQVLRAAVICVYLQSGVSTIGAPQARWMVYFMENPRIEWMIWE
jgi:hypothetical protein